MFESASIVSSVPVTLNSLVLATTSHFPGLQDAPELENMEAFMGGLMLNLVFGLVAAAAPLWSRSTGM